MKVIKVKDYKELSRKTACIIASQITLKPTSVLGLATGSTPIGAYEQLIAMYNNNDLDFSGVTTINLDEYCGLTGQSNQSYRYFMNTNLFNHVNIDKNNTYVPCGTSSNFELECKQYDELIASYGGVDIQLLGLGHNGHIGFNEPSDDFPKHTHTVDLTETTIEANTRFFKNRDEVPKQAITMGIGSIMSAKQILLIVSGKEKCDILNKALYGAITPNVPASILQLHNNLTVICCVE